MPKEKIRDVIGTGGKVIREIVATTGAKVDIEDDGTVKICSSDPEKIEAARKWILGLTQEAEVGKVYDGKVVNLVDFGAFVNFMGGKDGLVHVSEIKNERVAKVSDVLTEGQEVKVKVLEIDPRGKVRLSMRVVDQETGAELEDTPSRRARAAIAPIVARAASVAIAARAVTAAIVAIVARAAKAATATVARAARAAAIAPIAARAASAAKAATTTAPRPSSRPPS